MIERCEICDEPTGNAGRLDASIICDICDKVICKNCIYKNAPMDINGYMPIWCKECGKKYEKEVE